MLRFTSQANEDLSHILAGLISFRIGGAPSPSLSQEHAENIFDDLTDHFLAIPQIPLHLTNTFEGLERYGKYVYTYKRNRTSWYAFYDKEGDNYVVRRITNNWNILLPRL